MLQTLFCLYAASLLIEMLHTGYSRLIPHWWKGCWLFRAFGEAGVAHFSTLSYQRPKHGRVLTSCARQLVHQEP